ncbi:MAG: N-acetyl-alpha-D-glucosaminyl L-malate synthase BshA, partial [Planctomycetes bacterium]|nr:N-acetyl-alpha-D-glucosaminyl L-malate synthase BshA [Planctomycetota bacterium]
VVATQLSMALADRGHQVHLVSYEMPFRVDRWRPNLFFHAVDVGDYPLFRYPPYTLNLTNKLIEVVENHDVELIHSHYAIPHAHAAWMAREVLRTNATGDPVLACTLHGTDITLVGRERGFYELTKFVIAKQDLITAPSGWLAKETDAHFATNGRVQVVPNFVDLERFKPDDAVDVRKSLAPPGYRIIAHASNFRPVKRIEEMVGAFVALRKRMPAVLVLCGDGPELPKAEHLAKEAGVRDDLRVLGRQDRLEAILQAADLFLLPSRAESFGLAALEAMACGCPVLGYRAGGLPEVVTDGVSGILCDEGKDVCLGALAADLLADEPRYRAMRLAARAQAERFAEARVVDQYERMLQGALEAS